jgi:regulator of sigma E protease
MMTIAAFVFVIGVLVFIHEFGHFIVAKLFKIKVEVFSLGLGPRLIGYRGKETDYRISLVPLGGYVKMLGENPDEIEQTTESPNAFMSRPKWQRFLVALAGPTMNIVLALVVPAAVFMYKYAVPAYKLEPARVGFAVPGSPAESAGLKPGDVIVEYDGRVNPTWSVVDDITILKPNQMIPVVIDRQGQRITTNMTLRAVYQQSDVLGDSGMLPAIPPDPSGGVVISQIQPGTPAEAAGLRAGDKIIRVEDTPTSHSEVLMTIIATSAGRELRFTYLRDGQEQQVTIVPFNDNGRGRIGSVLMSSPVPVVESNLGPIRALEESYRQNLRYLWLTKEALAQIFQGQRTVRETFAGPLRIAEISGQAAQQGARDLFMWMSILSLSLGVFNLFPIPVLDGGLIFMLGLEWLMGLTGRQLSVSLREKIQTVGLAIIVILMGYIIYSDFATRFSSRPQTVNQQPAAQQPAPANK